MDENYEIVKTLNSLKSNVGDLSSKLTYVIKYPAILHSGDYLTEKEACAVLHYSRETLRKLRKAGKIAYNRSGLKILYPADDLLNYMKINTNSPKFDSSSDTS